MMMAILTMVELKPIRYYRKVNTKLPTERVSLKYK